MIRCMGCMREYEDGLTVCPHCGYAQGTPAREAYHLPPETILNGRYLVGRVLGFGGFGTTYIAWDLVLEKKVAIKEYMPSDFATRAPGETQLSVYDGELGEQFEAGLKSFIDESRRLAKFNHEDGIVHIFDSFLENGTAYIVMEYLEGKTLKELLKERGGKIPYEEAVGYILPVLKSLDAVHQTGIIHRDIAPDNIFLTNDGKVKLIDFGASRYATTLHSKSLSVILKQGYAPEEQYRSHGEQGPWSDVYAVCATLYRAITGVVPEDALERCANDKLVPPSKMGINLPVGVENAILNGLNTKAENRIQSAKELAQALSGEIEVQRIKEEKKKEDVGKWSKKQIIIASCSGVAVLAVIILAVLGVFSLNKSLDTTLYATVPDYIGMTLEEAQSKWAEYCKAEGIENVSLAVSDGVTSDQIGGYHVNQIYAINPESGSWFEKKSKEPKSIYLTVVLPSVQDIINENLSKSTWKLHNLENYSQADAQKILESMAGVKFTFETSASEKSAGTVVRTEPGTGTQINKGDTIVVYVSDGSKINAVEGTQSNKQETDSKSATQEDKIFTDTSPQNNKPQTPSIVSSGKCGDNAYYSLDSNGLLNITGTGSLYDKAFFETMDAYNHPTYHIVIENGITAIGNNTFASFYDVTSIEIPNSVTSIDFGAFFACEDLTTINIPKGVTYIDPGAFFECRKLLSINVAGENPIYSSRDGVLFDKEQSTLICFPPGKGGVYTIPNGVTTIAFESFGCWCFKLTGIKIPNTVTIIGDNAFDGCIHVNNIEIPNSVVYIGDLAFSYWNSDQTINIKGSSSASPKWSMNWNSNCDAKIVWDA